MPGPIAASRTDWSDAAQPIVRYLSEAQPLHARLQQVLTQLAGYSLLVMTRGRRLSLLDAPVAPARDALGASRAQLAALCANGSCRHHHHHLTGAADALAQAIEALTACLRRHPDDHQPRAELSRALQAATGHLRAAARLLPGCAMVDVSQACCATHAGPLLNCEPVGNQV